MGDLNPMFACSSIISPLTTRLHLGQRLKYYKRLVHTLELVSTKCLDKGVCDPSYALFCTTIRAFELTARILTQLQF